MCVARADAFGLIQPILSPNQPIPGLGREVRKRHGSGPLPPLPPHRPRRARFGGELRMHSVGSARPATARQSKAPSWFRSSSHALIRCRQVPPGVTPGGPLLSPDGEHLVYTGWDDKPRRLGMVRLHGSHAERLLGKGLYTFLAHQNTRHSYINTDLLLPAPLPPLRRPRRPAHRRAQQQPSRPRFIIRRLRPRAPRVPDAGRAARAVPRLLEGRVQARLLGERRGVHHVRFYLSLSSLSPVAVFHD